jgi:hypothetical protein
MAFSSNYFDVVWGLESVCYAERKQDFPMEAYRVLRPGGYLVVADFFLNCSELDEIQSYSLEIWLDGWAIPNLYTQAEFLKCLNVIGYKNVRMRDVTSNIRYSSEEIYLRGKEGYPDDILTKNKSVVQIKHVQACLFQRVTLELGVITFSQDKSEKEMLKMKYFASLETEPGLNSLPHNPCQLLAFDLLVLPTGEQFAAQTGEREVLAVILGGQATFDVAGKRFEKVGGRPNVFAGKPHSV